MSVATSCFITRFAYILDKVTKYFVSAKIYYTKLIVYSVNLHRSPLGGQASCLPNKLRGQASCLPNKLGGQASCLPKFIQAGWKPALPVARCPPNRLPSANSVR